MRNLGKHTVRTHYQHFAGGVHDTAADHTHVVRQTVYEKQDGTFWINYMSGKREVTRNEDGAFEYVHMIQAMAVNSIQNVVGGAQALMASQLEPVLALESGDKWVEIENDQVARFAAGVTQTAIAHFYAQEALIEGRHPRRWFVLVGPTETSPIIGKVALCVLPENETTANPDFVADCHTTGYQNANPYPEFEAEIDALAEATNLPITPNYKGRPINNDPTRERGPSL
jgi:hypothetical protein